MNICVTILICILCDRTISQMCELDIHRDIKDNSPFLLQPGDQQGIYAFFLPDRNGRIAIPMSTTFQIACNDGTILLPESNTALHEIDITCLRGDIFRVNGANQNFRSITCSRPNIKSTMEYGTCLNNKKRILIGYQLRTRFLEIIQVCFDDVSKIPIYSSSEIQADIEVVVCPRPFFEEGISYNLPQNVDTYYKYNIHQRSINLQLGLPTNDVRYVNHSIFITRGHLIAKADLMYPCHQICTFFHLNVAPQWNYLNNEYWNDLEIAIRRLALNRGIDLKVVAGTHGVLKLPNYSGDMVEIYLYKTDKAMALPVPEFYWKVVYDKEEQAAVVFVATNSPIIGNMRMLCRRNVCAKLSWITVDPMLIYCCDFVDFEDNFGNVPHFNVQRLLV